MKLPTLYHKSKSGSIRQWTVWTEGNVIKTEHGTVGGQMQIATRNAEAKNVGRANSTTSNEQADAEAQSMWTYQRDRKYRESIKAAQEDELALPMLARSKVFKREEKNRYPVDVQPKFDGVRCLAFKENGEVKLTSRNGKPWTVPHIAKILAPYLHDGDVLDGELYVHGIGFQTITSWVKKLQPDTAKVCYYVYDCPEFKGGDFRWQIRQDNKDEILHGVNSPYIINVHSYHAWNADEVFKYAAEFVSQGFEGGIVRLTDGMYRYGYRSNDLLKVKDFKDEEFEVVGHTTGELGTKEANAVIWECRTKDGKKFKVRPRGSITDRETMAIRAIRRIGHLYKVKFFEYTDDGLPRFPVGLGFRDTMDMS